MRVVLLTSFAASRKEPLATVMEQVHKAFLDAGLGEPVVRFNFGDAPTAGFVSSVDRVLKRHPELARFVTSAAPMPGIPGARRISNGPMSPAKGETVPFSTLHTIAAGVPRSFPFHSVVFHFYSAEFGEMTPTNVPTAEMLSGVLLTDSWWVNGRNRSLSASTVVEADPGGRKLPPLPEAVAAVLAACGKIKKTVQAPLAAASPAAPAAPVPGVRLPTGSVIASADPEAARKVHAIVMDYRARLQEVIEQAALPHDLPVGKEEIEGASLDAVSGPKKPALERAFKPMGYSTKGESGTFTLRRRTAANLTVELHLDVGTWSHSVTAIFRVLGVGFKATVILPVTSRSAVGTQYRIGNAERWQKIVENLAALVAELDRSMVPEIEAAAGPSPEWYQPES